MNETEFQERFGSERQCVEALARWKWSDGFRCSKCGHTEYHQLSSRGLRQCKRCHHQNSATSATLMHNTKLPIAKWFHGLYLLETLGSTVHVVRISAELGISHNAAGRMRSKLVRLMNDRKKPLRLDLLGQQQEKEAAACSTARADS